jgi:ferredoxin
MKIIVDHDRCQGHARCAAVAPGVYRLDEQGYNRMPPFDVSPALQDDAVKGARACPERAIKVLREPK